MKQFIRMGLYSFQFLLAISTQAQQTLPRSVDKPRILFEWTYDAESGNRMTEDGITHMPNSNTHYSTDPAGIEYRTSPERAKVGSIRTKLYNSYFVGWYGSTLFGNRHFIYLRSIRNTDEAGVNFIERGLKNPKEKCIDKTMAMYQELAENLTIQNMLSHLQVNLQKKVDLVLEYSDLNFSQNFYNLKLEIDGEKNETAISTNKGIPLFKSDFYQYAYDHYYMKSCWSFQLDFAEVEKNLALLIQELESKK